MERYAASIIAVFIAFSGGLMMGTDSGKRAARVEDFTAACAARCESKRALVDTDSRDRAKWACACAEATR